VVQPNSSPRKNLKKYYVVTVGSRVSGAQHRSFSTHEAAMAFYLDVKKNHLVSVVRDPGDDALFGPSNDVMQ
jgi:hypothetical protein